MVDTDVAGVAVTIPTPHSVGVRRFTPGVKDSRGNPVDAWADPVTVAVHGVAPGSMGEPGVGARDLSLIAWTIYAPAGTVIGSRDLVVYQGREYRVNGEARDWTTSPWPMPIAGVVIELLRAEG